jgi:transcriptional regulator with XRE-family HTH domain
MGSKIQRDDQEGIDQAIGASLRDLREKSGLSAKQLSVNSGVSAAMISRIESGQVSPSITTLNALSKTLNVPLVSLFRGTTAGNADFTFVKKGEGLKSTRIVDMHSHDYVNLALHTRHDLQFEARLVTLIKQDAKPPVYVGQGVVMVYVLSGEAIYGYGDREFKLEPGDSLTLDAEMDYGFREIISPEFTFLTVQAERR